jgi:biopolymer transport protein ExbD
MPEQNKASGWKAAELRTRFVPKSRIRSGLASISPWLDLVLILFFFMFSERRIVMHPGVIVNLPVANCEEGVASGMIAVVLALDNPDGASEVVFFDDEPYAASDEKRMSELKVAFKEYSTIHEETALTIYSDEKIAHGTISKIVQIARDIGLERVNMGIRE